MEQKVTGIRGALTSIVGEDLTGRYGGCSRNGDRIDDWEALVARVSRRYGTAVNPAEIAGERQRLTAGA